MQKYRSYVLPAALVLGLLLHKWCAMLNFLVPFLIFSILLLTFCAVDIKKLRMNRLDVWLMLFQIVVSLGSYLILKWFGTNDIVAQGVLIGVLCPVASSVAVISCMLGANRETVTAYTIIGNLMVAVVAPVYFSFIGTHFKRNLSRCIFVDTILDSKHLAAMLQKQGWKLSKEQMKYLSEY